MPVRSKIGLPPRHGLKTVRSILIRRKKQSVAVPFQQASIHPQSFVFYERNSGAIRFRVEAEDDGSLPVEKVAGLLASPMQGTVLKIAVEPGARVEEGALIAIIEAMKMENEITAHKAGTVRALPISVGASVASGDALAVIES